VAARDLAAFAFIPPGKKNSRGAWRLRQIEVGYNMLPQVRRGVTERRRTYVASRVGVTRQELISDEFRLPRNLPRHQPGQTLLTGRLSIHTPVYRRGKHLFRIPPRPHLRGAGHRIQIDHECGVRPVLRHTWHTCKPGRVRPPSRGRPPGTGRDEAASGRWLTSTGGAGRVTWKRPRRRRRCACPCGG
jgi:hypothetical protein